MRFGPADVAAFALFGGALLAAVAAGEALRAWAGWRAEASRRFVHASVGVMVALAPPLFTGPAPMYLLAAAFVAANVVAVRRRMLPGMHAVERPTWGTVVFPLALIVGLGLTWSLDPARTFALRAAFLVLAFADPLASIVGEGAARPRHYRVMGHVKSIAGSAAFFVAGCALTAVALAAWGPPLEPSQIAAGAVVAAGLATAAEALLTRGWDNLGIVVSVLLPLVVLHAHPDAGVHMAAAMALAAGFALAVWRVRFLDLSGAMAAGLLAWLVLVPGRPAWVVPGLAFFVLSSILSRAGGARKAAAERFAEKSGRRDAAQVLANGGVAGVLVVAYLLLPSGAGSELVLALYWGVVGAFAAAAADTWATEIGTMVGGPTWRIPGLRRVAPGESGGVSLAGSAGAAAGAAIVFASAWLVAGRPELGALALTEAAALIVGAGLAGCAVDSLLGGSLQARYRASDGSLTERRVDEDGPLPLAGGAAWMNNDRVNIACTLVGAAVPFTWLI